MEAPLLLLQTVTLQGLETKEEGESEEEEKQKQRLLRSASTTFHHHLDSPPDSTEIKISLKSAMEK